MPSTEDKLRDYLKLLATELSQTQQRLKVTEEKTRESIAIVGVGCRFPGGVRSAEDLWRLVVTGGDGIS
ncbi:beta-ketoacyl synthase N-terminal-like domain-containing protein, partial [Micromonospora sp. NPDC049204]|uniref:beta-ketoacyl synthase N-terminal-like domain-containing protein n=1 Tax=Micromonospora TaxID=1873 RepID=UPI0033E7A76F